MVESIQAWVHEEARDVPVIGQYDVVVAGGGVAGLAASVAAARAGASVILIEANSFLGGAATAGGMNHIGAFDREVIGGVCAEVVQRLEELNASQAFFNSNLGSNSVVFNAEVFKFMAMDMLSEAGVEILVLTSVSDVIVEDGRLRGVIVENKSGRSAVLASAVVDTTGDGDLAALAGAEFEVGRKSDGKTQAITLMFQVGDIDYDALISHIEQDRTRFREVEVDTADPKNPQVMVGGFEKELREAFENGDLSYRHEIIFIDGEMGAGASINATHLLDFDGTNALDLSRAQVAGLRQVMETMAFLRKYIPGFANATLRGIANRLGVRETRRIMGEYQLTQADLEAGRRFEDRIGRSSAPLDIHDPGGPEQKWVHVKPHDIPFGSIVPLGVDGLLMAGRCISATHEALASVRFQPACMVTGQAAGVAAALSAKERTAPRALDVDELQDVLRSQGVILD